MNVPTAGRCKSCKYWTRTESDYDKSWEGRCSSDKFVESAYPQIDGLQYWDYEGYSAGFSTGEDFGCVHWVSVRDTGTSAATSDTQIDMKA